MIYFLSFHNARTGTVEIVTKGSDMQTIINRAKELTERRCPGTNHRVVVSALTPEQVAQKWDPTIGKCVYDNCQHKPGFEQLNSQILKDILFCLDAA